MTTLTPQTTRDFLGRFCSFYDSLLKKIEISYANGERVVTVWVETRDTNGVENNDWVCVCLVISGAKDFCFADHANTTNEVISNGLHICWFGSVVGLDLGCFADAPGDLDELKLSECFVAGSSARWSIEAR